MMIETTKQHDGAWLVSAIVVEGDYVWREWSTYYGYTKRESVRLFRQYVTDKGYRIS